MLIISETKLQDALGSGPTLDPEPLRGATQLGVIRVQPSSLSRASLGPAAPPRSSRLPHPPSLLGMAILPLHGTPDLQPVIPVVVIWDVFDSPGPDILGQTQDGIVKLFHVPLDQLREALNANACGLGDRTAGCRSAGPRTGGKHGESPPAPRARAYPVHHLPWGDEQLTGQSVYMQGVPSVWDQQLEWLENTDMGEAWVSPAPDPPA